MVVLGNKHKSMEMEERDVQIEEKSTKFYLLLRFNCHMILVSAVQHTDSTLIYVAKR